MLPIGMATASDWVFLRFHDVGCCHSGQRFLLTPFANGVSIMVYGLGGYRFGDFWKLGIIVMAWAMTVTVIVIPLYWKF
jgi:Sodium:sulfate symporter transmembrane region